MQVWDSYNKIIGAGIGLTPACDDAMIGAMSVIYHLCLSEYNFSLGQYFENTKRIRNDLVQHKKTTIENI